MDLLRNKVKISKKKISLLVPDWSAPEHIHAGTTLRHVSDEMESPFDFNLATHVGDDPVSVKRNRRTLKSALALPAEPRWLLQTHSTTITEATSPNSNDAAIEADASFSMTSNVVCAVLTADCMPILVTDVDGRGIAAIHAGWRGLANGIISSCLEIFCAKLKIRSFDCLVWLGPAISQSHFEVGREVYDAFTEKFSETKDAFVEKKKQKYSCDLYHLARLELQRLGVSQISGGDQCTYTQDTEFYSHRRHTHLQQDRSNKNVLSDCGRMASLIWMNDNINN